MSRDGKTALLLFAAAVLVRFAAAVPGIMNPELLMRPDSASYLAPAMSLAECFSYSDGSVPTALRVPLYPAFLSLGLLADGMNPGAFCILLNILLSSAAVPLIWMSCREYGLSPKLSLCGTSVYLLTPTPIALAPMFLSDGLFGTVAALELLFLIRLFRRGGRIWLYWSAAVGGAGVLVRPLNLLWILPCLFVFLLAGTAPFRIKMRDCAVSIVIFLAVFSPWILRNHAIGSGWRIDAVSADSLKHNAAITESRATGIPAQHCRDSYDAHFKAVFASEPERFRSEDSRLSYQEAYLSAILKKHPYEYLKGFYHPVNYVPDVPGFLENLGLSRGGKGTLDVIVNHGLFAGVRHYFSENPFLPVVLLPLCLILMTAYAAGVYGFFALLTERKLLLPLLFLPMGLYYMTVTGPVAYPRFSLPGLPYLCVLSAAGLQLFAERIRKKKQKTSERTFPI